ncbi:hypothetical protein M758_8G116100, partial [Ceratodon purpureus]
DLSTYLVVEKVGLCPLRPISGEFILGCILSEGRPSLVKDAHTIGYSGYTGRLRKCSAQSTKWNLKGPGKYPSRCTHDVQNVCTMWSCINYVHTRVTWPCATFHFSTASHQTNLFLFESCNILFKQQCSTHGIMI